MQKTINHADLVEAVSIDCQETEATVKRVLASLASVAKTNLANNTEVTLHGLGKLKPIKRAARIGNNPRTGDKVAIPACNSVKFSLTKDLKEALN